jgi:hypothetical protein
LKLIVYSGKNIIGQRKMFFQFMWLQNSGEMEVITVGKLGGSCTGFVKSTVNSCMEIQMMMVPIYVKMV